MSNPGSRDITAAIAVLLLGGAFVTMLILGPSRAPYDLGDCITAYARARTASETAAVDSRSFPGNEGDSSRLCSVLRASPAGGTVADSTLARIHYVRHEFHAEDEERDGSLVELMYDIPYLGACGIFPPLHILNATLLEGGGDGGMGPGASWKPFSLTLDQYAALVADIRATPVSQIRGARYVGRAFAFDSSFDGIRDHVEWIRSVCAKHRRIPP